MNAPLLKAIKEIGVSNCLFIVNMTPVHTYFGLISIKSSNDKAFPIPCVIDETRDKIGDEYKITLRAIEEYKIFGSERFYISDLAHLIKDGTVKMYSKIEL